MGVSLHSAIVFTEECASLFDVEDANSVQGPYGDARGVLVHAEGQNASIVHGGTWDSAHHRRTLHPSFALLFGPICASLPHRCVVCCVRQKGRRQQDGVPYLHAVLRENPLPISKRCHSKKSHTADSERNSSSATAFPFSHRTPLWLPVPFSSVTSTSTTEYTNQPTWRRYSTVVDLVGLHLGWMCAAW